ncbi:ABCB family ABC transporter ATP-binding protein/permease [Candidatus Spongiihabitans sp.]|uniref:ABCB family ABC transporter ATP-binding protein/permease n=1 Tax=Candidatus Spongiihabitans sp. TaxID=3101308 RepID=UPI003C703869
MSPRLLIATDQKGDWRVARRLLPYLWKYRYRIGVALMFLVLARVANVSVPLVLKNIVDHFTEGGNLVLIVPMALLIAYGVLRFSAILFNEMRNVAFSRAGVAIIHHISMVVFKHLHNLSLGFHLDRKTGGLSRDMERGNMAVTNFLRIIVFNIIPVAIEIALVLYILWLQLNIRFVLITVLMIVIYCVFTFMITRWRTRFRVQMNDSDSSANTRVLDSLLNYETVKVFGNERLEMERYGDSLNGWVSASLKNNLSLSYLNAGQGFIIAVGLAVLMILAANGVVDKTLSLGDFVMINAFLIQLYIPLNFLGSVYRDLNHSLVDMEKMFDLMDERPKIVERDNASVLKFKKGQIRFENINFAYQADNPILKNINFEVAGGGMLALVGPSGSGKSTLARLLLRFYDPDSGAIYIDDQDIKSLTLESLRQIMGVVPQDTVLFNETVGYNIAYGRPGVSDPEIVEAAKIAQIHDFISQHPQGYDILVGERGLKLSGGEKQRVAIARVAVKGARILIFDEATSSLDSRSEKAIQQALENVSINNTTLIVAHRLSTVINADEIIVLDKGEIVERGTHQSLVAGGRLYSQMWALQQQHG